MGQPAPRSDTSWWVYDAPLNPTRAAGVSTPPAHAPERFPHVSAPPPREPPDLWNPTRMLGQTIAIARNTFLESVRQPIFFIMILIGGGLQIVNTLLSAFTMGFTEEQEVFGDDKLLYEMGLATVVVCAILLAAFVATSVLSREIENKTALTVISKPVGRPWFVIGKYVGVSGAILLASVILLTFFLFAIRHKVMSTARDEVDGPVVLFSSLAVLLPIALAIWGNYFYGWVFSSTAVFWMFPAVILAYLLTLTISKQWEFQSITTDLKPQILLSAGCALIAVMVLTAVAVAASTRLGQVMTIVVCAGVFMIGLLSNHLIGRYAFENSHIGVVRAVTIEEGVTLAKAGDRATISLQSVSRVTIKPGMSIYFGGDPSGVGMEVPVHEPFTGNPLDSDDVRGGRFPPALVVRETGADNSFTLINVGGLAVSRPPQQGDYVFATPTRSNFAARTAWAIIPNIQSFWLTDAVTQGHKIPPSYVGQIAAYGACQIVALLGLAVMLFQRRDVG